MRITVDIEESDLKDIMEVTGETKKGPAVAKAAVEFMKRQTAKKFGKLIMESYFDYPHTAKEIDDLDG